MAESEAGSEHSLVPNAVPHASEATVADRGRGALPRTKVIACRVFAEELRPLLQDGVAVEMLEISLHEQPQALGETLQERIDASAGEFDTIILGYGMCSRAVVGLRANGCTLVMPRVDDCIGMFLGSTAAQRAQLAQEPGTYFLTKGWIGSGVTTPFTAYDRMCERWGVERADRLMHAMLRHYRRLLFIRTGDDDAELAAARAQARATAERFGLVYDEIEGSDELVHELLYGPWDERYIVVPPGETVQVGEFLGSGEGAPTCRPRAAGADVIMLGAATGS